MPRQFRDFQPSGKRTTYRYLRDASTTQVLVEQTGEASMSKILAIIDLDTNRERGQAENPMLVNNSERSRIAREYANQFASRQQTSAFFAKMFDPELVQHDVIEEEARTHIERIEGRSAQIVYLTSRPHTMQAVTEHWLAEQAILRPCFFKNYGTGKPSGPDGKPDVGDRYMKTAAWKAREVSRIISQVETEQGEQLSWILFVDDEETNRQAVAELGDLRILLRCSLEDAATHDFQRREIDQDAPPFLKRLQELANLLDMREAFEMADKCQLVITRPQIPGASGQEQHTSIMIESWRASAYAPGADPDQRYYRHNELYPQRNELSEIEQLIALQCCCDQAGRVVSLKMAKSGPAVSLLNELEDVFDQNDAEKAQRYADEWVAHSILEFGYVEVARAQRGMQLLGKPALDAYLAHIQAKNEEIKAAFRGTAVAEKGSEQ
jgi:hypothetical protein